MVTSRWTRWSSGSDHRARSEEHTSELQSQSNLVCRLLLEKKKAVLHLLSHVLLTPIDHARPLLPRVLLESHSRCGTLQDEDETRVPLRIAPSRSPSTYGSH